MNYSKLVFAAIPQALADPGPGLLQRLGVCSASGGAVHLPSHPRVLLSSM